MKTRLFAGPSALPMIALAAEGDPAGGNTGAALMNPPGGDLGGQQQQQQQAPPAGFKFTEFDVPADRLPYVTNKGWKDTGALLESYQQLEKLTGVPETERADRLLVAPKADAKPEEIAEFIARAAKVDVPAEAKDYAIKLPEGVDPVLGEAAAAAFKYAGVPKTLAPKVVEGFMAFDAAQHEAFLQQSTTDIQALQAELGDKFDDEMEIGRRAAKAAGIEGAEFDRLEKAIGTKKMLNMFRTFGKGMGEAKNPVGDPSLPGGNQFTMSKEAAQAKISANYANKEFMARYLSPNAVERKEAVAEMEALFKAAN